MNLRRCLLALACCGVMATAPPVAAADTGAHIALDFVTQSGAALVSPGFVATSRRPNFGLDLEVALLNGLDGNRNAADSGGYFGVSASATHMNLELCLDQVPCVAGPQSAQSGWVLSARLQIGFFRAFEKPIDLQWTFGPGLHSVPAFDGGEGRDLLWLVGSRMTLVFAKVVRLGASIEYGPRGVGGSGHLGVGFTFGDGYRPD